MSEWIAAAQDGAILWLWQMEGGAHPLEQHSASADSPESLAETAAALMPGVGGPIVACGLPQAGFRKVPCEPLDAAPLDLASSPRRVAAIPGLAQENPAHVTQGAETKMAGFLALNPKFDGVLCLPGTETAWAHVSAGEVVSFQTFATADLARDSAARLGLRAEAWDEPAFLETLSEVQARPERLAGRIASLRAEGLLAGLSENVARARLWGALVGAEMAATRPYWLGQPVAVIGEGALAAIYVSAVTAQGAAPVQAKGQAMLLKGLAEARARLG
ncbi:2-dehydro-3-deoxygalactonokinase [Actibacterium sp. MT2.3-13A]|uniref:2-dehydro-3-deoxygalactonokinase n=1 Tax=Actibacterium sp. MT2.3-13A TaxID=2828332 RepID=UPI001BA495E8|nr:2-dehydro-3-deoxygalactonokinase [Actibacterium sp. MT2.3-13A]